jgi:hypothetical protein
MEYLIGKSGVPRRDVVHYRFKNKRWTGWPGDGAARTADGVEHMVPNAHRLRCKDSFTGLHCRLCFDKLNVTSDLMVGDAWGVREDKAGVTLLVPRTAKGVEVLASAERAGVVNLEPVDEEAAVRGQKIDKKRRDWAGFMATRGQSGVALPDFRIAPRWLPALEEGDLDAYRPLIRRAVFLHRCRSRHRVMATARRALWLQAIRERFAQRPSWRDLGRRMLNRLWKLRSRFLAGGIEETSNDETE